MVSTATAIQLPQPACVLTPHENLGAKTLKLEHIFRYVGPYSCESAHQNRVKWCAAVFKYCHY